MTCNRAIGCAHYLRGDKHGDHTSWSGELQPSLQKSEGQVRAIAVAPASRFPPVVSPCKPCAERRREQFRSQPWRVSYDDIESPSREYIRKVTLVVEPRDFSIAGKLAAGVPYLTKSPPEPGEGVS